MLEVRTALLDLLGDNSHDVDDPFVFFSLKLDCPVDSEVVLEELKDTLARIGVDAKAATSPFIGRKAYTV